MYMQFIKMKSNNFEVNKITINGVSTHLKLITISACFTQHDLEIPASGSAVGAVFWLQGQYVDFLVSETFCSNLLSSQRSQFKVTGSQFAQIITTTVLNVQFSFSTIHVPHKDFVLKMCLLSFRDIFFKQGCSCTKYLACMKF